MGCFDKHDEAPRIVSVAPANKYELIVSCPSEIGWRMQHWAHHICELPKMRQPICDYLGLASTLVSEKELPENIVS
jgi:hypothetical protein